MAPVGGRMPKAKMRSSPVSRQIGRLALFMSDNPAHCRP
jgi:hypothetical protein